jgi:methylthioribose-1-phosphate isomerase
VSTRSTASSSTDDAPSDAPAPVVPTGTPAPQPEGASEVDRRAFFRAFSRQAVSTVGQVAGVAGAVSRMPGALVAGAVGLRDPAGAAHWLEDGQQGPAGGPAGGSDPERSGTPARAGAAPGFHSTYRVEGDTLFLLDQRLLPGALEEIPCRSAADVAAQIRAGAVTNGPVLGQLAAYGYALAARAAAGHSPAQQLADLRWAGQLLAYARPASRTVRTALRRMEAVRDRHSGTDLATALWLEAERIHSDADRDHAQIGRHGAELLHPGARQITVLVHGDPGMLSCGAIGTVTGALKQLADEGCGVKVWATEGGPTLEGARLLAWELGLLGIEHAQVADAGIAWLLEREPLDAVLLGGLWIAANGDTSALVGSRAAAELADLGLVGARPVPVYVFAPTSAIARETLDGQQIPTEMRHVGELAAYRRGAVASRSSGANPAVEIVPAGRISGIVTEVGVLRAPYPDALAAATTGSAAATSAVMAEPLDPAGAEPAASRTAG